MEKTKAQATKQKKKFKITSKTVTRVICLLLVGVTILSFVATALVSF